jgi:phosphomevalonate kinase
MTGPASKWSAPGSLLISGEYLITEEGGTGLALAAGGRAELYIEESSQWQLSGRLPEESLFWKPSDGDDGTLMAAVFDDGLISTTTGSKQKFKLCVDTKIFFDTESRKLGYGSSAAAALLYSRGLNISADLPVVTWMALKAHRRWQGGHGSGYDIITSANGGAGCFTGGEEPAWTPLNWPEGLNCWVIKGPGPVNSSDAVKKYRQWRDDIPAHWKSIPIFSDILSASETLKSLLTDHSLPDPKILLERIHELAIYGNRLGEAIGVPAMPTVHGGFNGKTDPWHRPGSAVTKCLGAGDETIFLAAVSDGLTRSEISLINDLVDRGRARVLKVESDGLKPEYPK